MKTKVKARVQYVAIESKRKQIKNVLRWKQNLLYIQEDSKTLGEGVHKGHGVRKMRSAS